MRPLVYIIILNWNQKEDTLECLRSLQKIKYLNYRIVIVDNGSTDGSQEVIKKQFSQTELIQNYQNLGCAGGRNKGIKYALSKKADYVFLLDNDTIVDPYLLEKLVNISESNKEIGIVGAKVYYFDEPRKIWFAGGKIDWLKGVTVNVGSDKINEAKYNLIKESDFAPGCAFFIKKEVIEKIGLIDERYFIYFEEVDWCIQVAKAGYKIIFAPEAKLWHKVSSSLGSQSLTTKYYFVRNQGLFIRKNRSVVQSIIPLGYYFFGVIRNIVSCFLKGKHVEGKIWLRGASDFIKGKYGKAEIEQ